MKDKGFTLIELLAVIIILGILMIIAIPSVTSYISGSRKSAYIDTAKELINGARNLVNDGNLEMFDADTTYYIDVNCIKAETGTPKSPYGEFTKAYVIVTYNGKGYDYYWTSVDDAGEGIPKIVKYDSLNEDDINSDMTSDDISTLRGIDGRSKSVKISKDNGCEKEGANPVQILVNTNTGVETHIEGNSNNDTQSDLIDFYGKERENLITGDPVKIENEEFYVISNNGTDLILLSRYNLNVGPNARAYYTIGIQNANADGGVKFNETQYWEDKVGTYYEGSFCNLIPTNPNTKCAYVYDSNSNIYQYVTNYKSYLEDLGITVKGARLLKFEEARNLGCGLNQEGTSSANCYSAPSWVYETDYWLGSVGNRNYASGIDSSYIWFIRKSGAEFSYGYCSNEELRIGVRPVIII